MVFTLKVCYVKKVFLIQNRPYHITHYWIISKGRQLRKTLEASFGRQISHHSFVHTLIVQRLLFREETLVDPRVYSTTKSKTRP